MVECGEDELRESHVTVITVILHGHEWINYYISIRFVNSCLKKVKTVLNVLHLSFTSFQNKCTIVL